MWLLLAFLAVPLIEIALFVQVGGVIGLWPTLAIVVLTAVLGTWLMRTQGALALADVRRSLHGQSDPTEALAHGAMILVAGVLLLTPGFFTDALGFALLMPPVRRAVLGWLRKRVSVVSAQGRPDGAPRDRRYPHIIEGDFHEVDPPSNTGQPPSGWTRH